MLLETIHEYARERLAASGEQSVLKAAHARYYLALAEEAEPRLSGAEQGLVRVLEPEHDNLRAVLRWAKEQGETEIGLRVAGGLGSFWSVRGYWHEGRRWLEGIIKQEAQSSSTITPAVRAQALWPAGLFAEIQGEYAQATALYEESLALCRELSDTRGIARALHSLGSVAHTQGDLAQATALFEESLALRRELGDLRGSATSIGSLGENGSGPGRLCASDHIV